MIKILWGQMYSDTSKLPLLNKITEGLTFFRNKYHTEPDAIAIPYDETPPEGFSIPIWARRENHKGLFVFVKNDFADRDIFGGQ